MSELSIHPRSARGLLFYGLAAALLIAEAGVAWLMLHPKVSADFRAYYIDKTTTCLNQPVSGAYAFGTMVSLMPDGAALADPLLVCGWEGPSGEGTHAVGTSSRLRFIGTVPSQPMKFIIEGDAITKDGRVVPQRVDISFDGQDMGDVVFKTDTPEVFSLPIAPEMLADNRLEVELDYPDAVSMGRKDADTRWRSIKLVAVGVVASAK